MNRSATWFLTAAVALGATALGAQGAPGATADIPGAGENAAFDDPARLAWRQFAAVNRPAVAAVQGADPAPALWETWASAAEVFADPNRVPQWPAAGSPHPLEGELVQQRLLRTLRATQPAAEGAPLLALPAHPSSTPGEVRYNRTAFDWIVLKQLWYLEGQQKAYDYWAIDQPTDVEFPAGSVVVKAVWRPIGAADKGRYHWREKAGVAYGLVALHLISKILPGWFWATFEQVDNPGQSRVAHPDPFGQDDSGAPSAALLELLGAAGLDVSVWRNYRLDGTQTGYLDLDGAPVVLANSVIEAGFTATSSCMTCHVRSTIGEAGQRLSFDPLVGAPEAAWFVTPAHPPARRFLRLDFLWSLARAKAQKPAG